ncbi:hypothetical protein [Methylotuvimicrobium buryatense]|uniref:hypothetical protein n=1 Tax=Methylotuvimicrobium buryatense TaxID=95641 RepID=UPI0015869CF8|nr:hypothetical protein [Methylotuvimicrobium buryatense]
MKTSPSPRQMKVRGVGRVRSLARQDAVNTPIYARRRRLIAMDGMNADFAGAKICPAADACRSGNRTLFGIGIFVAELLYIEKLDKESTSTNFHSK